MPFQGNCSSSCAALPILLGANVSENLPTKDLFAHLASCHYMTGACANVQELHTATTTLSCMRLHKCNW